MKFDPTDKKEEVGLHSSLSEQISSRDINIDKPFIVEEKNTDFTQKGKLEYIFSVFKRTYSLWKKVNKLEKEADELIAQR